MLEKIRSVNKWVWLAIGAAVIVAAVVLVLVLLPGEAAPEAEQTGGTTAADATTTASTTTVTGEETTTVLATTVEGETTTTTGEGHDTTTVTEDEVSGTTSGEGYSATGSGTTTARPTGPDTTVTTTSQSGGSTTTSTTTEPTPTATNPDGEEILGEGSKDQPYLEYPDENMTVDTASIPAGKSLHYEIYRVGGMILTVDSPKAYVVYEGKRYNAVGGVVTVEIGSALASAPIHFEIGNTGSSATSFTLQFTNPVGSYMNPVKVTTLGTANEVSLPAGTESGYYYKYIAEKDGTVRFYLTASQDSILLATNNRNSAQRTTEADGLTDDQGEYVELEVQKGDEILINVGAKPNARGKYPAVDISWRGVYA